MKVHLKALGCRLNEAELETWAQEFRDRGATLTQVARSAEIVVVNTCAVTEEAVRKSRKLLRRIHREKPDAKIVVTGCYGSIKKQEVAMLSGVDLVVENHRKDQLPRIVAEAMHLGTAPAVSGPGADLLFHRGRQRAFIKVQDGCRYRCSYCVVTLARGEERSRPVSDVVAEINGLASGGVQEVVLTGVHLGGYGSDSGENLASLVTAVLERTGVPRVRLGSLEPWDIPPAFWDLFGNPRLMPHLHLPLQSGADSVLRRMARRCRTAEFRRLVAEGRRRVPELNITTDIIAGFPGETEEEFEETLGFVEEMEFADVHVFAFSPRDGTRAAALPGAVSDAVKRERSQQLHALARRLRGDLLARHQGRVLPVLVETVENRDDRSLGWGYTPGFLRVAIDADAGTLPRNTVVDVVIDAADPAGHLSGRLTRGRRRRNGSPGGEQ